MGLKVKAKEELGANEYIASDPEKGKIRKQVNYFLAEVMSGELHLAEGKGGLDEVRWFALPELAELKMYDDIIPFITKAIKLLNQKNDA